MARSAFFHNEDEILFPAGPPDCKPSDNDRQHWLNSVFLPSLHSSSVVQSRHGYLDNVFYHDSGSYNAALLFRLDSFSPPLSESNMRNPRSYARSFDILVRDFHLHQRKYPSLNHQAQEPFILELLYDHMQLFPFPPTALHSKSLT